MSEAKRNELGESAGSAPSRLWLQWDGDAHTKEEGKVSIGDVTWCSQKVFARDVEYVQAAEIERWRDSNHRLRAEADHQWRESIALRRALADFLGDDPVFGDGDAETYPTAEQVASALREWARKQNSPVRHERD